ncbi:hypothetical protein [Sphingopyxis sp. C-1]|uniref:hypothetical protein n=1 Tax=Sphingopyxis sp. C-1 TaxID=262667 RepID=UPI0007821680|nr:hypothetical protein [Sphingopyxis sp. C-1]
MRKNYIDYVQRRLPAASGAIEFEPDVIMDLRDLEFESLPVVLAALIGRGHQDKDSIRDFFDIRGCPYDWEITEFVIDQFEGKNPNVSLWAADKDGVYNLIVKLRTKFD